MPPKMPARPDAMPMIPAPQPSSPPLPSPPQNGLSTSHLRDIESLSQADIEYLLTFALYYTAIRDKDLNGGRRVGGWVGGEARGGIAARAVLDGVTLVNLFLEPSTRTNLSFELAGKNLGAKTLVLAGPASSILKGESREDTVCTLAALGADLIVIRDEAEDALDLAARALSIADIDCRLINAGTGTRAHPTQAIIDVTTLLREFDRSPAQGLEGLNIAICGDIRHSRVARSNAVLMTRLGARLRFVAPSYYQPPETEMPNIDRFVTLGAGIEDCDIVMVLRVQKERHLQTERQTGESPRGSEAYLHDYASNFMLTHDRLIRAKPTMRIMHPGPINRGVEIDAALADDSARSLILKQVANGITARMGILHAIYRDRVESENAVT